MSRIEAPSGQHSEGLGGSFSRNVKLGEHGLGMLYNRPGDVFHLKAVWEDSQGGGTSIAPGTFEYIYFREQFDGNTYLNRISSRGVWIQIGLGSKGKRTIEMGRVEDLLEDESSHDLAIEAINPNKPAVTEVILKKWGHFEHQNDIYSRKMNQLYGLDLRIPDSDIEMEFSAALISTGIKSS